MPRTATYDALTQVDVRTVPYHAVLSAVQADETIYGVVQLANALETSRFADFWTAANGCRDLLGTSEWWCCCATRDA